MTNCSVHPFPARMAPELALDSLRDLPQNSVVLDPMAGSGTVLRQALDLGHQAIGFDVDPLAVLMSRVGTTPVQDDLIEQEYDRVREHADRVDLRSDRLAWQSDKETQAFVTYWFAAPQRRELMRLAFALNSRHCARLGAERRAAVDVLRLAISRIIVTKEQCASLARDTSHSRPHRVAEESTYDVRKGYERSVAQLRKRLLDAPVQGTAQVQQGDARRLPLADESICAGVSSPPYLNAIDYMRGHRLALVWLGYSLADLRSIRATAIGAERALDARQDTAELRSVVCAICDGDTIISRLRGLIRRYADDLLTSTREMARVLRPGGSITYVVGNSCVKDVFVDNASGLVEAARLAGLRLDTSRQRPLPANSRYLPMTGDALAKRMRTESVLTFHRP